MKRVGTTIWRKARQVACDPTLLRWLAEYAVGRTKLSAAPRDRLPAYLSSLSIDRNAPVACPWPELKDGVPQNPIVLELAGNSLRLNPGEAERAFTHVFADTESLLALHRFAWIPCAADRVDPLWVGALWRAWLGRHAVPDGSWAWHPYTAAERLINITTFAQRHGLPGSDAATLGTLARHGPAIFDGLEYFGEAETGNHLANNGRGLFLGGIALGREDWADMGGCILVNEARRIFAPSGILREGSSHYHLLATRWYLQAAEAARSNGRPEAGALTEIAARAQAIVAYLMLPGGLPLLGDVSPDCPPALLCRGFGNEAVSADRDAIAADGWVRLDVAPWHALMFAAPGGWSPLPGHAHRDFGSLELHYGSTQVLCDLGRGTYGPAGAVDIGARAHNTVLIDGVEPYPPNRPYYDEAFRERIAGPAPVLRRDAREVHLASAGFARLSGVGTWHRCWRFEDKRVVVEDRIEGRGRHRIARHFHTRLPVGCDGSSIRAGGFAIHALGDVSIRPSRAWSAYGAGQPASSIEIATDVVLPWTMSAEIAPL